MPEIISKKGLAAVEAAVKEAEKLTSGEIVPFIVKQSSSYPVASWRGGAIFGLGGLMTVLILGQLYAGWSLGWLFTVGGTGSAALVLGALGVLLVRSVPAVERFFAGSSSMTHAVRDRSMRAFVEEEVFDTRERTGILIFISLFERRVEVVGDSGINARVESDDWVRVVEDILTGIRDGTMVEGLVSAVNRCGSLLEEKGVEIREDDTNELSDSVRFSPD
ncbi:MAG: hypothetical protein BMS9Abin05_0126 [Rhodothermia bacterium]|nr:MAG: hypothetical protein BMS9Abin05_0126 [Rhodothermia bacterium]